ncbi:fibronectin type III domain-containing protein [Deltaproteobacteria bacterium TL4]
MNPVAKIRQQKIVPWIVWTLIILSSLMINCSPPDTSSTDTKKNDVVVSDVSETPGGTEVTEPTGTTATETPAQVVADTTAPTIINTIPFMNDKDIAIDVIIQVSFSEAMDVSTITSTSFVLSTPAGQVPGLVSYENQIAKLTPSNPLGFGQEYTVTLTALKDSAGNLLPVTTWKFTTYKPPYRLVITPNDLKIAQGGELSLMVRLMDGADNLIVSSEDNPIIVAWETKDVSIANIDEQGLLQGISSGTTQISAQTVYREETLKTAIPVRVDFSDVQSITISPPRLSLDIGGSREFAAQAKDNNGNPTSLDCEGNLQWIFDANYIGLTESKSTSVVLKGIKKGMTPLVSSCGGFKSTPAFVEIKPAITIPKPAPDSNFGLDISLANQRDQIHIASYDAKEKRLTYTYFKDIWNSEHLDGEGDYGRKSQIVLDSLRANSPVICALEGKFLSSWIRQSSGSWVKRKIEEITPEASSYPGTISALVVPDGRFYVLYYNENLNSLKLATSKKLTRDDWTFSTVIEGGGVQSSLTANSEGAPRVAFQFDELTYYGTSDDEGKWSYEEIDNTEGSGIGIKLKIGQDNRPQVVYYKTGKLMHAIKELGIWGNSVIANLNFTGRVSLGFQLDRNSLARISFYDESQKTLLYATKLRKAKEGLAERWSLESPNSDNHDAGKYSALAIDRFQLAHIAYYDSTNQSIKYYVEPHFLDYAKPTSIEPDVESNDDASGSVSLDIIPPLSITDLSAVLIQNGKISLSWTAPQDNHDASVTEYELRYAETAINNDQLCDDGTAISTGLTPKTPGSPESYTVTGVNQDTTYYFCLRALDAKNNRSLWPNQEVKIKTPDTIAPAAITDLKIASTSYYSAVLSWTAPGDNLTQGNVASYEIRHSTIAITNEEECNAAGSPLYNTLAPQTPGSTEQLIVMGLEENTTYYFCIHAEDEVENRNTWSGSGISVKTLSATKADDALASSGGQNPTASSNRQHHINVTQQQTVVINMISTSTIDPYLYLVDLSGNVIVSDDNSGTGSNAQITYTLTPGNYKVVAATASIGESGAFELTVAGATFIDLTPPANITTLVASGATANSINLTWTAVGENGQEGKASSYDIRYATTVIKTDEECGSATAAGVGKSPGETGTTEQVTITDLNENTSYYFCIRALDSANNKSQWSSNGVTASTTAEKIAPASISNLSVANATENSLKLLWTAVGDDDHTGKATTYDIRYATSAITNDAQCDAATPYNVTKTPYAAGTNETLVMTNLTPNTKYYFCVRALDDANNKGTWTSTEGVSGTTLASETGGGGGNGSGGTVDENSPFTIPQSLLISGSDFKTVDLNGDGLLDIAWIENGNIRYALQLSN